MTYFGFLFRFLIIPIVLVFGLLWADRRQKRPITADFRTWPAWTIIVGLIVVAVVYTTPWDNYLVATAVWWYDPNLVTGVTLGYVPIEEYTFFVLQTLLSGMWVQWLLQRPSSFLKPTPFQANPTIRWTLTGVFTVIWVISTAVLFLGSDSYNYLTLILSWALIPILIQTSFGGDILWHYGRILLWGIVPMTAYLATADAIAIMAGTWTISPDQTINFLLGGILPFEEFLFFLITNVLVVFGMTLFLARASHERAAPVMPKPLKVIPVPQPSNP